jgi:hypothetical protein
VRETRTITEAAVAEPDDTKYAYPPAITADVKPFTLLVAPVALAAVRVSELKREKDVDATPPATSRRTSIDGFVAVPAITSELVTSKTAHESEFSPEFSVRVEHTVLSVAKLTFITLPGDVDVPTKAVPVRGSETKNAPMFSPVARVRAAGEVTCVKLVSLIAISFAGLDNVV